MGCRAASSRGKVSAWLQHRGAGVTLVLWGHHPSQPSCRHPIQVEDDLKASGPSSEVSWVVAPSGPGGHPILGRLGSWRSCLLALMAPSLSPGLRLSEEQKCLIPQLVGERCQKQTGQQALFLENFKIPCSLMPWFRSRESLELAFQLPGNAI